MRSAAAILVVSTLSAGCYPSFEQMLTTDYRAHVSRVEGSAQAQACRPTVRERPEWGDGIDFVYEVSGCTPVPILYACQDIQRFKVRSDLNGHGKDANCQPVLPAVSD